MTEDRVAQIVEWLHKNAGSWSKPGLLVSIRAFASECEEAGAYVRCETCGGLQTGYDASGENEVICTTCDGEGRIRRELAGVLWAAEKLQGTIAQRLRFQYGVHKLVGTADLVDAARDRWSAKAKEEAK